MLFKMFKYPVSSNVITNAVISSCCSSTSSYFYSSAYSAQVPVSSSALSLFDKGTDSRAGVSFVVLSGSALSSGLMGLKFGFAHSSWLFPVDKTVKSNDMSLLVSGNKSISFQLTMLPKHETFVSGFQTMCSFTSVSVEETIVSDMIDTAQLLVQSSVSVTINTCVSLLP